MSRSKRLSSLLLVIAAVCACYQLWADPVLAQIKPEPIEPGGGGGGSPGLCLGPGIPCSGTCGMPCLTGDPLCKCRTNGIMLCSSCEK